MFARRLSSFVNTVRLFSLSEVKQTLRLQQTFVSAQRILAYKPVLAFGFAATTTTAVLSFTPFLILQAKTKTNMAEQVQKAEELYNADQFKEVYEYLLPFKDCDDPELLWRFVRASRDRSTMNEVSKEDKKAIIFEAFEASKKALELGEDNYACHKWYGIMLSQTGDYIGTKKKIEDSPAMKKHFEKAIELNPGDATSRHLMGMWCFSFADLAWYERKIAAVVFGSPPESTYQEAYDHFKQAEDTSPSFYSENQYMLGLVCLKLGKKDEAKEWFTKLQSYKVVKDSDKESVEKGKEQLKKL